MAAHVFSPKEAFDAGNDDRRIAEAIAIGLIELDRIDPNQKTRLMAAILAETMEYRRRKGELPKP